MNFIEMVEDFVRRVLSSGKLGETNVALSNAERDFQNAFGFQRDTPPCSYPLASEVGLNLLIKAALDLRACCPPEEVGEIVCLGQTPAWSIITLAIMEFCGVSNRYRGVAFSGSFFDKDLKRIVSGPDAPTKHQIDCYREYLLQQGLDPKTICDNFSKNNHLVFVEYTETAKGLASFLSILSDWAEEFGLSRELREAIRIHLLIAPNTFPYKESFACGFDCSIQEIDPGATYSDSISGNRDVHSDFTWLMAHADPYGDRVVPSFKLSICEECATDPKLSYPKFGKFTRGSRQQLVLEEIVLKLMKEGLLNGYFFLPPEAQRDVVRTLTKLTERNPLNRFFFLPPKWQEKQPVAARTEWQKKQPITTRTLLNASFFKSNKTAAEYDTGLAAAAPDNHMDTDLVSSEKFDREIMKTPVC